MGISNWLQLTTAKWQGIRGALPRLWDGYFNPAGFTHWFSDFPAHALAKPITVAATDKTFWAAHYASEIAELQANLATGMKPESMVIQLVELQGLIGRYTLSPMSYEQGLHDCYQYVRQHLSHPQPYLQQLNQVQLDFRRALKQQPAFTQECLQGDLAYGLQQGRSNLLPIFQYYRAKLPIIRYGQTLQQLQQVLAQNFQLTQTDRTLLLLIQCQRELQPLNDRLARANQAERHQASLWAELPFADELIASIVHEHVTTAFAGSAANSLFNTAKRLAQFAYDHPGLALTYGLAGQVAAAATFAPSYSLADLDGRNGFALRGVSVSAYTGYFVNAAGDINDDGINDLVLGAHGVNNGAGAAYVVFGRQGGFPAALNVSALNGVNGFVLPGINAGDVTGISVSGAGDVNGDGISDLIVGAQGVNGAGAAYVVFGHKGNFPAALNLATLNGANGFVLQGINANDRTGVSVSGAGDINGDGISDLIVGANGVNSNAGAAYVVFGRQGNFPPALNLATLNGTNGFVVQGINANTWTGFSVSSAGDINDDGTSDLIVSAFGVNGLAGEAYVVFGHQGNFPAVLSVSSFNGTNGFVLQGINTNDQAGISVSSAGDINGDDIDDLIVGAWRVNNNAGAAYVMFGHPGNFPATLNLASLNGINGFALQGIKVGDHAGVSVSYAGDINGDKVSDLVIGAQGVNNGAGASYVVFGHAGSFPATLHLATLNGANGFVLQGSKANDATGRFVRGVGDINGDGGSDLIVGAPSLNNNTGAAYVVFGKPKDRGIPTDPEGLDAKTKAGIGVAAAVGGAAAVGLAAFGIWKKCRKHPAVAAAVKRRSKGKSAEISLESVPVMPTENAAAGVGIPAAGPLKTLEINYAELIIGRLLGQGGFGKVYQGTWRNQAVAIKELVVRELSPEALASFRKEVSILAQLSSEFIVRFYGAYFGNPYCMVMEYMPNGSLYATLHSSKPLDWLLRCGIALDIAKGLHYLHQANVLHRDVKSLNVLLDGRMRAKLSDFGLAKVKEESTITTTLNTDGQRLIGSIPWMAPELFTRGNKYTAQADIYSYGMVLWEIAARQVPFAEAGSNNGLMLIQWIIGSQLDPIPDDCPPAYARIIQQCWQRQPEHRPTLEEIIQTIQTLQETGPEIEYHDDPNVQPLSTDSDAPAGPSYQVSP